MKLSSLGVPPPPDGAYSFALPPDWELNALATGLDLLRPASSVMVYVPFFDEMEGGTLEGCPEVTTSDPSTYLILLIVLDGSLMVTTLLCIAVKLGFTALPEVDMVFPFEKSVKIFLRRRVTAALLRTPCGIAFLRSRHVPKREGDRKPVSPQSIRYPSDFQKIAWGLGRSS